MKKESPNVIKQIILESIENHAVDIILGMDDLISMGYRESVTMQDVSDQLRM